MKLSFLAIFNADKTIVFTYDLSVTGAAEAILVSTLIRCTELKTKLRKPLRTFFCQDHGSRHSITAQDIYFHSRSLSYLFRSHKMFNVQITDSVTLPLSKQLLNEAQIL